MVIFCSLLVALSFAVTFKMPLASMSKVTSTCGTPRGAVLPAPVLLVRRDSRCDQDFYRTDYGRSPELSVYAWNRRRELLRRSVRAARRHRTALSYKAQPNAPKCRPPSVQSVRASA